MVHLQTFEEQRKNFENHYKEICESGYLFAVIGADDIEYFNDEKYLYEKYPIFSPNHVIPYGTHPLLIDIDKITNSLEYRIEKNQQEIEECNKNLRILNKKNHQLEKERKKLRKEKRQTKKAI